QGQPGPNAGQWQNPQGQMGPNPGQWQNPPQGQPGPNAGQWQNPQGQMEPNPGQWQNPQGQPGPIPGTQGSTVQPKKKGTNKYRIIGIAGVVAAVLIVAGAVKLVGGLIPKDTDKMLVYESEGSMYYVSNMDKEKKPIEFDTSMVGFTHGQISEDGKYFYYIKEGVTNALYRAELGKLSNNSKKNSKYVEEIAGNVKSDYDLYEDGKILYVTDSEVLCYYEDGETNEIDSHVDSVEHIHFEDNIIYYTKTVGKNNVRCYYDLKKKNGDSYAKNVAFCDSEWKDDKVLYLDDDVLCQNNREGDEKELADKVFSVVTADAKSGTVYFLRERTEKHSLYDFVEDDMEKEDKKAGKEPSPKDYFESVKESSVMTRDDQEYYQEYAEPGQGIYDYLDENYDMSTDYELNIDYYYNYDNDQRYYHDATGWYLFDEDAYERAYEAYESVDERNQLRKELKEEKTEYTVYDLYRIKDGKEEKLAENVSNVSADEGYDLAMNLVTYQKPATGDKVANIKFSSIDSYYDVSSMLYDQQVESQGVYYSVIDGKEKKLDASPAWILVSPDEKSVVLYDAEKEKSYCYKVDGSGLKQIGKLSDQEVNGVWKDEKFYFVEKGKDGYGDFSVYCDGKETKLLENILVNDVRKYEDGNYTAMKSDGELYQFDSKGKGTRIALTAEDYEYINDQRIVYLQDNELYVYTGEEAKKIARDVSGSNSYWCVSKSDEFYWEHESDE
ncbi:MAG: proline-rich domain-containing protein, partial [Lachnospiraceae bacterium]